MSSSPIVAPTIDTVIERLTEIIDQSSRAPSRLGYFAALYRRVTVEVKHRIAAGFFDDGARMESLDIIFANRYLDAYDRYRAREATTESWSVAFDVSTDYWPIVLQHLLVGMNAHINLDLGIAAAEAAPGRELSGLRTDFNRINSILQELTGSVYETLGEVWPLLRLLKGRLGSFDTAVLNFSMTTARDGAWRFAERVSALDATQREDAIRARDRDVARVAGIVLRPGVVAGAVTKVIRIGERQSIPDVIALLS